MSSKRQLRAELVDAQTTIAALRATVARRQAPDAETLPTVVIALCWPLLVTSAVVGAARDINNDRRLPAT